MVLPRALQVGTIFHDECLAEQQPEEQKGKRHSVAETCFALAKALPHWWQWPDEHILRAAAVAVHMEPVLPGPTLCVPGATSDHK